MRISIKVSQETSNVYLMSVVAYSYYCLPKKRKSQKAAYTELK